MIKRFLASVAVYGGSACKNAFVEISGDDVSVTPFERETHSTVFVPGVLYITKGNLKDEDLNVLMSRIKESESVDDALAVLMDFDSSREVDGCDSTVRYYIFSR